MVECRSVPIGNIVNEANPRLCLSPLRYLGKCYQCPQFVSARGIPCNSRLENHEAMEKLKEIEALKETIKQKQEELASLKTRLKEL